MSIKKKLEKLEKYVIIPNVKFYGGFIYKGEDMFLCDDTEEDEESYLHIIQRIENNFLITDGERYYKRMNGKSVKDSWHQEVELEVGKKLIYIEGQGFALSEYKMVTIDEAKSIYDLLKGENYDSKGNERKDS